MTLDHFMQAARVPRALPPQSFGLWKIERFTDVPMEVRTRVFGRGELTILSRWTDATLHLNRGEVVMEDSPGELRRHMPIWRHGCGDILVSGLGLGCVVRGLLIKNNVVRIDVVEIDPDIIRVVGAEFARNDRVRIFRGDALEYDWPDQKRWDYAWHDVWCPGNDGLAMLHARLVARYLNRVKVQGFWGPGARIVRRQLPKGRFLAA